SSLFFSFLLSIAGCMYRVVQTTGPDGINLLKLLPISKSSGNFVPILPSTVRPDPSRANIPQPLHVTFKRPLANTPTPSTVKIPVFQTTNPGKIILTRALDKQENLKVTSEKESLTTKTVPIIQNNPVSVDRLSLQNIAVSASPNQNNSVSVDRSSLQNIAVSASPNQSTSVSVDRLSLQNTAVSASSNQNNSISVDKLSLQNTAVPASSNQNNSVPTDRLSLQNVTIPASSNQSNSVPTDGLSLQNITIPASSNRSNSVPTDRLSLQNVTIPASSNQSNSVPVDRIPLQNVAAPASSNQSKTAYMFVNSRNLPVTVKSPVLPSGHHLQIPADAEVKSVPASSLPPAIQQKILAATGTNASGATEATKTPTVIYVSPVNTVKTVVPKRLPAICPKPVTEVSKPLILTTAQTTVNSSVPGVVTSNGQPPQQPPMKWVVQENPKSAAPCLVPVKSSNNMASKILKTLANMKNVGINSANILPTCSNSSSGSQTKITPIKDNALVMYNGKVYLLTKRGSDVLSAQVDTVTPSTDAQFRKEATQLIDSNTVDKITNKVVNLVLSKSKGIVIAPKDPKTCINTESVPPSNLKNSPETATTLLATPNGNQPSASINQTEALPKAESISSDLNPLLKVVTDENTSSGSKEKDSSPAATTVVAQPKQHCDSSKEQKIQSEKVCSSENTVQNICKRETHRKQYLELRKKFGLSKEERVYLKRIPFGIFPTGSKASVSSNNLKNNDSCSASPLEVEVTTRKQENAEEKKIIVDLQQDWTKKRKEKPFPVPDNAKKKKTAVSSLTNPSLEDDSTSSITLSRSTSQQKKFPTSSKSSLGKDSEQDPRPQNNQVMRSCSPVLVSSGDEDDDDDSVRGFFREDAFPLPPPDLDETIRDEKIKRLKQLLREREAALEELRKKRQQT
ncbi:PREDICTED: ligand-dependent nuclear receptor-interacting factor 1, partial [Crocodylus porosus]